MKPFKNMSNVAHRKDVSVQELLGIMECDTYSEAFLQKSFKSLGKDKVTAQDILNARAVDVDSRLHAFFALHFLTEKQSVAAALEFTEQSLTVLEQQPRLRQRAEEVIHQLRRALEGDTRVDTAQLESELLQLYAEKSQGRERLVFEALLRVLHLEAQLTAAAVAGSARAAAAWSDQPEETRQAIANRQLQYLITVA